MLTVPAIAVPVVSGPAIMAGFEHTHTHTHSNALTHTLPHARARFLTLSIFLSFGFSMIVLSQLLVRISPN